MRIRLIDVEVKHNQTLRITTSGYNDRFLMSDTAIAIEVRKDKGTVISSFSDRLKALDFLMYMCGFSFNRAYSMIPPPTYRISGWVDRRRWQSRTVTSAELASIKIFLSLYTGKHYAPDFLASLQAQAENNPLQGDLLAIVKWHLRECDRKNIETWGYANGQNGVNPWY